ncbi:hypothetical protein [Chamaesiphon sp. OTE_75_metabat_556]|nr:hypothetical protein [Chamaesiphon sp. OTE_75_metabat_556]
MSSLFWHNSAVSDLLIDALLLAIEYSWWQLIRSDTCIKALDRHQIS